MENTPEISDQEKRDLVGDILKSEMFAANSERSTAILNFLLERHLVGPEANPTRSEIFAAVYTDPTRPQKDPRSSVASAVTRIRGAILQYFEGPGIKQFLRLNIPPGGHALVFERAVRSDDALIQWFWDTYLRAETPMSFGLVPAPAKYLWNPDESSRTRKPFAPDELRKGEIYPILRIYHAFFRMFSKAGRDLTVVPMWWEMVEGYSEIHKNNTILIGDDKCIPLDGYRDAPGPSESWVKHQSWSYRRGIGGITSLGMPHFPFAMYRDQLDRTTVGVRQQIQDLPNSFVDTKDTKYVLLTRHTLTGSHKEVTLLSARDNRSIVSVADFITTGDGLRIIELRPELRKAMKRLNRVGSEKVKFRGSDPHLVYKGGAPLDFQILFSVPAHDPSCKTQPSSEPPVIETCYVPSPWKGRAWV